VPPEGAEVEELAVIALVFALAKLLFVGVTVAGEARVAFFATVNVAEKLDNRLSAIEVPPAIRDTYKVLPLPAGLASCKAMITEPPRAPREAEFVAVALYSLPV
jgi:hypothetical protein